MNTRFFLRDVFLSGEYILSLFWKKNKEKIISPNELIMFPDGKIINDFFIHTDDPLEMTQKLLVEIQKRCLSDQVLLVNMNVDKKSTRIDRMIPSQERPIISEILQQKLLDHVLNEQRTLFWEDFWGEDQLKSLLKECHCQSVLVHPINITQGKADFLIVINYSEIGSTERIIEFISSVSSLIALSCQNSRLFNELKKKNIALKKWSEQVEQRISEGTKKLLEKEVQYHSLFEGTNDGIVVHDFGGRFIEVNHVICRKLGYEKKELLNLDWMKITPPDKISILKAFFQKVIKKDAARSFEIILYKKSGTIIRAELSSRKVRFDGKEVIQSFVRDITLKNVLAQSQRESKEKYRIFIESSLVGVFVMRKGIIQFTNGMFEEITGYERNELFEKNFYDLIDPRDRPTVENRESRREKGENIIDHYEVRFKKKSGEECWTELRSSRVVLDKKNSILGNVVDISKRKQLQIQLLETQKLESIGTLAGGIAHDFNNLLGGILGYASLLLSEIGEDHPYYSDIKAISDTTKRAAELTNSLLAFARGGKYRVIPIQINRVIEDIIAIVSCSSKNAITIQSEIEDNLWLIKGDLQQIHQAILNIVINAIEAMPNGGTLVIRTSNVVIDEATANAELGVKEGHYIKITISDMGEGMDEDVKSRIFEPFFTTKPAGEGTGLGLSMVYGIVSNHGGTVVVDSIEEEGTDVTVYLPRYEEEIETKKTDREKIVIEKFITHKKILFVDDEKIIRQVARRMIDKVGHEVVFAANGVEAIEIFKRDPSSFDLVILDLIMPVMGGKETYRRIHEIDQDIPVVITSGYGPYDRPEFLHFEMKYFIQKPFQTEVLLNTIQKALQSSAQIK